MDAPLVHDDINALLQEPSETVHGILLEMAFLLGLLLLCEANRLVLKSRGASQTLLRAFLVCSLVLAWYSVSITLILFNKWVLTAGLQCPVFYTTSHMCLKGLLALAYYTVVPGQNLPAVSGQLFVGLSLVGAFASLDIACSNLSLITITTSFYTFLKSSSLIFVLIFGVITLVEPISMPIVTTVLLVSVGTFLMAYGEETMEWRGAALVLASEVFAALRWIVTQVLVQKHEVSAMAAVLYMSPAATLTLVPLAMVREPDALHEVSTFVQEQGWLLVACVFFFPGFLSFLLLLVEVQLVVETSSLTLTVFGNLKSVATVLFAVAVFGDKVSVIQWAGMLVAFIGMLAYSHARGEWLETSTLDKMKEGVLMCISDDTHAKDDETLPLVSNQHQSV